MSLKGYNTVYITILRYKIQSHAESHEYNTVQNWHHRVMAIFLYSALGKWHYIKCVFVILQTVWLQTAADPRQSHCCPGLLQWAWAHKSESQLHLCLPAWAQLRHSVMMTSRQYPWTRTEMVSCSKTLLSLLTERGVWHAKYVTWILCKPSYYDNAYVLC